MVSKMASRTKKWAKRHLSLKCRRMFANTCITLVWTPCVFPVHIWLNLSAFSPLTVTQKLHLSTAEDSSKRLRYLLSFTIIECGHVPLLWGFIYQQLKMHRQDFDTSSVSFTMIKWGHCLSETLFCSSSLTGLQEMRPAAWHLEYRHILTALY